MTDIDDAFKEQVNIFYYAHVRRVAQALFESGANTRTVAANLLLTLSIANRWHDLYVKDKLIKDDSQSNTITLRLPFPQPSTKYIWQDYAHEVKCAAKLFFDMGLGCRSIAIYLGVPPGTVYWWHSLYKKDKFEIGERPIGLFKPQFEKFTKINNRKYYSSEIRQVAEDCLKKGMTAYEVSKHLGIPDGTAYSWQSLFKQGRFKVKIKKE